MKREPCEIQIAACGQYPADMPESLREALAAEVQRHMEGYGCTDVEVLIHATPA
jgi:hypothetical protein